MSISVNTTVYTVGHSNRESQDLLTLLASIPIRIVVDIRSYPQSNRFPHFSHDNLRQILEENQLVYHWAGRQLGGLRPSIQNSLHIGLDDNQRGFADYMQSDAFSIAITQLLNLAQKGNTVLLCAEMQPEHCHRSLISDYLLLRGVDVKHLINEGHVISHQLSPSARRESHELIYDRGVTQELNL
ncbi:DUF488 domain-containing protein [Kaarinaea lacus]